MDNLKKSENLKLLPIAALLVITPLLSTSLRFKYLYFVVNILILSVGADAGLLSFFLHSDHQNTKPVALSEDSIVVKEETSDKAPAEERGEVVKSEPSIFFIGGDDDAVVEDEDGGDQELYRRSEMFIGNFYKQLKMQREESWNKIRQCSMHRM